MKLHYELLNKRMEEASCFRNVEERDNTYIEFILKQIQFLKNNVEQVLEV